MTRLQVLIATTGADEGFGAEGLEWIPGVINVGLHLFLVGSFLLFAIGLVSLVRQPQDQESMTGRALALFIGALVVVGAQAQDLSYTDFIIGALSEGRSPAFNFFGALIPAAAGVALGYWFTRDARRGATERAVRGLILVGTFCITQFVLMYAIAVESGGAGLGSAVTPNISFVAGLGLYVVMNYGVKGDRSSDDSTMRSLLRRATSGRGDRSKAPLMGGSGQVTDQFRSSRGGDA